MSLRYLFLFFTMRRFIENNDSDIPQEEEEEETKEFHTKKKNLKKTNPAIRYKFNLI